MILDVYVNNEETSISEAGEELADELRRYKNDIVQDGYVNVDVVFELRENDYRNFDFVSYCDEEDFEEFIDKTVDKFENELKLRGGE